MMYHKHHHTGAALVCGLAAGLAIGSAGMAVAKHNHKFKRSARSAARMVSDLVGNVQQMVK